MKMEGSFLTRAAAQWREIPAQSRKPRTQGEDYGITEKFHRQQRMSTEIGGRSNYFFNMDT